MILHGGYYSDRVMGLSQGIMLAGMDEGDLERCKCPLPGCPSRVPDMAAQQLLQGRQLARWQHLAAHSYANRSPTLQW